MGHTGTEETQCHAKLSYFALLLISLSIKNKVFDLSLQTKSCMMLTQKKLNG